MVLLRWIRAHRPRTGARAAGAQSDIPESATTLFKTTGLDRQYEFSSHMNPFYLSGDFDGDGKPDIAILVKQKSSGKIGIAVCHSSTNNVLFIGAGTEVGNGGDNFDWMDIWSVTPKATAARKVGRAAASPAERRRLTRREKRIGRAR